MEEKKLNPGQSEDLLSQSTIFSRNGVVPNPDNQKKPVILSTKPNLYVSKKEGEGEGAKTTESTK